MEDPKLEQDIQRVKELIKIWQDYYRLLLAAFDLDNPLPPDADDKFQEVKRMVTTRHGDFAKSIRKDHYVAQNILQMIKRTIAITDFREASEVAVSKTLLEWHDANLLLWETLGSLDLEKHRLSKISEAEVKREEREKARKAKWDEIRRNPTLYASIKYGTIAVVAAAVWFSPLRTMFVSIPFVESRINDFRELFGMEPLGGPEQAVTHEEDH